MAHPRFFTICLLAAVVIVSAVPAPVVDTAIRSGTNTQSNNGVIVQRPDDDLCKEVGDSDDGPCEKAYYDKDGKLVKPNIPDPDTGSNQNDDGKGKGDDNGDDGGKGELHGNADDGPGDNDGDGNGHGHKTDDGEDKYGNDIGEGADDKGDDGKHDSKDDDGKHDDGKYDDKHDDGKDDDKHDDGKDDDKHDDDKDDDKHDDDKHDDDKHDSDADGQGASDEGRYVNGVWVDKKAGNSTEKAGNSSEPACFPAAATVQLSCGCIIPMSKLQIGMKVAVGDGKFSQVYTFTHHLAEGKYEFVRMATASGHVLRASAGHYVLANGAYVPAADVQVGDMLRTASGTLSPVTATSVITETGLYNPQTRHGDIVVDGVVASTYTTAVSPKAAHAALAPIRAAFVRLGLATSIFDNGKDVLVF